jgi:PAS domain S-box-containing protein
MHLLRDRGPAGRLARIILPLALLAPVAIGLMHLAGERAGFYRHDTGLAFQVLANMALMILLGLGSLFVFYRADNLRRQRDVAVAQREKQFRLAEKVAHVGHWRMEVPSGSIYWSEEIYRIVGMDPESGAPSPELVGELHHPEDRAKSYESVMHAFHTGQGWDQMIRLIRTDGQVRNIKSIGVPELGPDGRLTAVFGVFADVTELEDARRIAEEATAAKALFLANMSHEIRTPLNSIIGFTDLLLEDNSLNPTQKRQLELVQNSGSALLTVVNDILDFSKMEAGKIELDKAPFALATLVGNTVSIIRAIAEAKGLEVRVSIDPGLAGYNRGDEARLRQILLNLLNNAVKFTAKGSISLDVVKAGGADRSEHGRRSAGGEAGPPLPAILAGRRLGEPRIWRNGTGACDLQEHGGADGWADRYRERRRRRFHILVRGGASDRRQGRYRAAGDGLARQPQEREDSPRRGSSDQPGACLHDPGARGASGRCGE